MCVEQLQACPLYCRVLNSASSDDAMMLLFSFSCPTRNYLSLRQQLDGPSRLCEAGGPGAYPEGAQANAGHHSHLLQLGTVELCSC